MSSLTIKNGEVLLSGGTLTKCDVLITNGVIGGIGEGQKGEQVIDAEGCYVLPGLIDLHTHGIRDISTDEGSLEEYAEFEASRGATTFYPTIFTPPELSVGILTRHLNETDNLKKTPQVGGFRLESPYLAQTGAGVSKDLAPISADMTDMLLETGKGHVKIWDISPELPGSAECIHALTEKGIICSLAHTLATVDQAKEAVDAGAKLVTHLFDTFVLPDNTDPDPGVYPAGLVDYLLVEDRITCEIIGDGTHVHPLLVEKTFRCKPADKLVFVTDSNFGAGMPPGEYDPPGSWGKILIKGCNDGVRQIERGMELAGSALTPIDGFRNVVQMFKKDIAAASTVCSTNPAKLMRLNKGEIAEGKDGDIIILDSDLVLMYTIAGGRIVYQKEDR